MDQAVRNHMARTMLSIISLLFLVFGSTLASSAQQPDWGVVWDLVMRIPSPEETSSWFPDLAVDRKGRVHVVWCETNHRAMNFPQPGDNIDPSKFESLYYSMWDGQQWSPANDIVPSQQDIIRNAITVDGYDVLHLLFDFTSRTSGFGLYYKQAQANEGFSAVAWTSPRLVNGRNFTYMSDIAVFQDTLHIVYDDRGAEEGECPGCADIYYRHSTDRGLTWSAPVALFPTGTGSNYAQIEIDKTGVVYLAWNEGWDRLTGQGDPRYGVYMYSTDGGSTWSAPTIVSYPNATNMRFAVGSNGQGGVMLVWRTASREYPGIYYMWSTDYGESWPPPQALPNIFAQPATSGHGMYDMATDSAGHIHLLVTGRLSLDQDPPGVYHLEWDGNNWSSPSPVYVRDWYPSYPHLVIDRGNQLHATWYISRDLDRSYVPLQVWYAHGQSQAPPETLVPQPTSTPTPEPKVATTPTSIPTPTAVPYLELNSEASGLPEGLYTENDEILQLMVTLSPVVLLVIVIVVVKLRWLSKLFR